MAVAGIAASIPGGASGKEPACQCRRFKRCGFDPWVGKISWRRAWQPTPGKATSLAWRLPWTEEPESDTTEQLSTQKKSRGKCNREEKKNILDGKT